MLRLLTVWRWLHEHCPVQLSCEIRLTGSVQVGSASCRYQEILEHVLPQLQWSPERQRVPTPALEARLLSALATSAFAPAALFSWQCHGRGQPLGLPPLPRSSHTPRTKLLRRRHAWLACAHRRMMKVGDCPHYQTRGRTSLQEG